MKQIEDLLREKIGLRAGMPGRALIEDAVASRLRDLGLKPEAYRRLLRESPNEWETLVEAVVVTETWFFRDREPFRALIKLARQEWLPAHPSGKLRILSVPCSTGEEPYSIAMALLDAEFPPTRFQIDAVDIRPTAIAHAERAEYGKNSFRGKDLGFRARYFQQTSQGYRLNASVRELVRFEIGNLLDDRFQLEKEPYDFIFCRNLLMYLDPAVQEDVFQTLGQLLTGAGVLFVGSAEVLIAGRHGFIPAKLPFSFSCRKAPVNQEITKRRPHPLKSPAEKLPVMAASLATVAGPPQPAPQPKVPPADLGAARQLADQGRLNEAAQICESYLHENGVSAEAYYLLGLVQDTAGAESEASEFYRRALYLEPDHYDTLTHWAVLSGKNGDDARARILGERAERIRKQT